jgi:hypothetical protein
VSLYEGLVEKFSWDPGSGKERCISQDLLVGFHVKGTENLVADHVSLWLWLLSTWEIDLWPILTLLQEEARGCAFLGANLTPALLFSLYSFSLGLVPLTAYFILLCCLYYSKLPQILGGVGLGITKIEK